jgi:hypothetical protein
MTNRKCPRILPPIATVKGLILATCLLVLSATIQSYSSPDRSVPQNPQVTAAERDTINARQKYKNDPSSQNLFHYYKIYARTEKIKIETGVREIETGVQNTIDGAKRAIDDPVKSYREMVNQNPVTVQPTSTDNQEIAVLNRLNSSKE